MAHRQDLLDGSTCNCMAEAEKLPRFEYDLKATLGLHRCPTIHSASDVALAFHDMSRLPRVVVVAGTLDYENRMICWTIVSGGSGERFRINESEVFSSALRNRGAAVFLVQNSPSGSLILTYSERRTLRAVLRKSRTLKCPVLDHVILTPKAYRSVLGSEMVPGRDTKGIHSIGKIIKS